MSFNFDRVLMCDRCGTYLFKRSWPQRLTQLKVAHKRGWLLESAEGHHFCPGCRPPRPKR